MSWKIGISWTKGYTATTTNPDGTQEEIGVHGGPFYFHPKGWFYLYAGFRPTPTWGPGYGDEGYWPSFARWRKRKGWGNLGIALRRSHGA